MHTVDGCKSFTVFLMIQSLFHLFSTSFCVTYLLYFLDGVTEASYADDTTSYSVSKTKYLVIKEIEYFSEFFFQKFDFK